MALAVCYAVLLGLCGTRAERGWRTQYNAAAGKCPWRGGARSGVVGVGRVLDTRTGQLSNCIAVREGLLGILVMEWYERCVLC